MAELRKVVLAVRVYECRGGRKPDARLMVVEHDDILGPHRVQRGDVVLALPSSGLHSNGYSLVRRVVSSVGWGWDQHVDVLGRTIGEECLEPTRIYTRPLLELARADVGLRALSHVTGGGLAANLARVLPTGTLATVERTWQLPPIFSLVQELGRVPLSDLEQTLNMGVGFVAIVAPDAVSRAQEILGVHGLQAWQVGEVLDPARAKPDVPVVQGAKGVDGGAVQMLGSYRTS